MADFSDHLAQAKSNLEFLQLINSTSPTQFYDWQVTTCFYVAVHLVNAHLSKFNLHYRRHEDVSMALNPFSPGSITKIPDDQYVCYTALNTLSRRSRYLVSNKEFEKENSVAAFTYDKHFVKALKHLDNLMFYFGTLYPMSFELIKMNVPPGIKKKELNYFDSL